MCVYTCILSHNAKYISCHGLHLKVNMIVVEKSKGPIRVMLLEFGVQSWGSCCSVVS